MFESVNQNVRFPELEEKIIKFWGEERIFQASLEKPSPSGNYIFYEGPPTANGKPGIHHVSARAFKDLYPRYKTMRGYYVQRRGGWDTHGLPVEVEIEKEIGSTGKQDIEKFGIAEFNKLCRESVFRYIQDWNKLTERIGFWIDLDAAYITYNNSYIETCWWILKSLWERGLLYEDYKTTMHCPRCHTSLADHEVSQGMREDVDDPSVWPKFPARLDDLASLGLLPSDERRAISLLAWTTTPWTLGANTALAVRGDEQYGLFESKAVYGKDDDEDASRELFILALSLADKVFGEGNYRVLKTFQGEALVGLRYEQILQGRVSETEDLSKGFRIVADDFVSIEDGTGIVHIAPAYGDLEIGRKHNLPTIFSVDLAGKVYPEVKAPDSSEPIGSYNGMFFKDADKRITRDLAARGLMFRSERVRHAYPFCWRDDSPLLFYAKTSWYIRTTAVKDALLENNQKINWTPEHVKTGRFGKWLENNIDWAISRERYWGTPLPVWLSEDGQDKICVGGVSELEELTGRDLKDLDLHRPYIDEITFQRNGQTYSRVPYTIDVWFESGAMPYAQWHYPFENREQLLNRFPADYICEAMDQTRGWFYSLHALATLLTDEGDSASGRAPGALAEDFPPTSAFKNCVALGFITDEKGLKMSKSRKNAVDPWTVLNEQGADALRWYMYVTSPPETNKNFHPRFVTEVVRDFLLTFWNVYSFFVIYANLDKPNLKTPLSVGERPEIDRWLISKLQRLIEKVTIDLDDYNVTDASRAIGDFVVRDLSNWYVRRNRRRFWKSENDTDKRAAYVTLYEALVTLSKLCAPMIPFVTEAMYRNLVLSVEADAPPSVHLTNWPEADASLIDETLLQEMDLLIKLIELGRAARSAAAIQFRQPLPEILVRVGTDEEIRALRRLEHQLKEELNVKQVSFLDFDSDFINYGLRPNLPIVGKLLGKRVPEFVKALRSIDARQVAEQVRRGVNTSVQLGDEVIEFEPSAFLVDVKSPEGYAAVEEGSYLVALNTKLTPELIMEGQARNVLRSVQNARKKANLNISDYIDLGLSTTEELTAALSAQEEYVKNEGLAASLVYDVLVPADYTEEVNLDGVPVIITLRRAATSNPDSID